MLMNFFNIWNKRKIDYLNLLFLQKKMNRKYLFYLGSFFLAIPLMAQTTADEKEYVASVAVIETHPVYPGCESVEIESKQTCFIQSIQLHVKLHFKYPEEAIKNKIQGRVAVSFKIDKEGNVIDIEAKGPEIIRQEAERIISLLPKMTPGMQRGVPVKCVLSLPISFRLD
jgi:protein TonB